MGFWIALWRGEKSLVFTFWVMGVILTSIMVILVFYATGLQPFLKAFVLMVLVQIIFVSFVVVSVFRSAKNYILFVKKQYKAKVCWGYLAMLSVVALIGWLLFTDIVVYLYVVGMKDF